jgi:predicted nucleic acid-binding protein
VRTAALMREHNIHEIYTAETDFLQFAEIKAINPLRA